MDGNSSGGVIQMFTDKAPATPEVSGDILFGSFNTRRESVEAAGTKNGVEYLVNYSNYNSDGFRQQSANDKRQATAKLGIKIAEDTKLTMLTNWFDQFAQDPGGLVRTAVANDPSAFTSPTAAAQGALNNNTRVYRSNQQVGFNLEHKLNSNNTFNLISYVGERENLQYLSTGTNSGRASGISRNFYGTELRATNQGILFDKSYRLTYGLAASYMKDERLDINTANQVLGATNRYENQDAQNFDQYVQGMWSIDPKWDLHAGVRHTNLKLGIVDKKLSDGDSSGNLKFDKTIPVAGIIFKASPVINFYANVGKGFETPTLTEMTFTNPTTLAGPNFTIRPSTSTNIEIGSKWLVSETTKINTAIFQITTDNEIVTDRLQGSTGSFKNAGKTKRSGAEISGEIQLQNNINLYLAYTLLDAKFDTSFTTGNLASLVNAGNYIPGTYKSQIYLEAAWKYQPLNFQTALEARYASKTYVNDTNTDAVPDYTIYSVRGSFQQRQGNWKFTEYARIDNIFDQSYIGSVRVNDANNRFFEPAPGRNWIIGVKANYMF
jgi:iron complex outermembrane receptor protein